MNLKKIINELKYYNEWRRGADTAMPDPKNLGICIDQAIKALTDYEILRQKEQEIQGQKAGGV